MQKLELDFRFAAEKLGAAGIRLLVEPINTFDIPGFYLSRTQQALAALHSRSRDHRCRFATAGAPAANSSHSGGTCIKSAGSSTSTSVANSVQRSSARRR